VTGFAIAHNICIQCDERIEIAALPRTNGFVLFSLMRLGTLVYDDAIQVDVALPWAAATFMEGARFTNVRSEGRQNEIHVRISQNELHVSMRGRLGSPLE
jgi:hypothetical protein